jgi:hypothetical protein
MFGRLAWNLTRRSRVRNARAPSSVTSGTRGAGALTDARPFEPRSALPRGNNSCDIAYASLTDAAAFVQVTATV